jgi:hypothetical protein
VLRAATYQRRAITRWANGIEEVGEVAQRSVEIPKSLLEEDDAYDVDHLE